MIPEHSTYYVDPRTARLGASDNTVARWSRWLYQGLHSLDLPWPATGRLGILWFCRYSRAVQRFASRRW